MSIDLSASVVSGQRIKPPKMVFYGTGGIGKTTFASQAPNPIFLFTEEGMGMLDVQRFEVRENDPILRSWEEITECCEALLNQDHNYQTLVLDNLDQAEKLMWLYTAAQHNQPSVDTNGGDFGFGRGYMHATNNGRILLDWLDALRAQRNMSIILLAHTDTVKFQAPDLETYDRYGFRLHKQFAAAVHEWTDAVFFANYRSHVVKDKEAFKKERTRGVGMGERVIFTEERPAFLAKNRYSLPAELPFPKEGAWQVFIDAMTAANPPQPVTKKKK